jgi:pilus assembly protein CpaC
MVRRTVLKSLGYFMFVMLILYPDSAVSQDLILVRGQQKTLEAPDMSRIAVGNPAIADVKALNGQILVTAVDMGQTDIIIWDKNDKQRSVKVLVVESDPWIVAGEIRQLLKGVEGIKIMAMKSKVFIKGKALRKEDLKSINQIAELYPQATNLVTLSPAVLNTISDHFNIELSESGLTDVRAERLGNQIVVQGEVSSEEDKEKIDIIASAFDVKVKNLVKVGVSLKKMVLVNVDFIEMQKGSMTEAGIDWGDFIEASGEAEATQAFGPDTTPSTWTGAYRIEASYGVTIRMVQNNNKAHIIARPKLLCRSGEKAEFLAGGEIPVKIVTLSTAKVEWKQFGILLDIEPVVDSKGVISTAIKVENSTISDYVDGQPVFQSSRVKTNINVKSGEIIVLSGLVNREHARAVDKIPLLGSIPILGELFKSRSFKSNQTELVIFVTPVVMTPDDPVNKRMIKESEENNKKVDEEFSFSLLD